MALTFSLQETACWREVLGVGSWDGLRGEDGRSGREQENNNICLGAKAPTRAGQAMGKQRRDVGLKKIIIIKSGRGREGKRQGRN